MGLNHSGLSQTHGSGHFCEIKAIINDWDVDKPGT